MELLYFILALAVGIAVIVKSSDVFVDGAAQTACYCGISQFIIGVIIVGFGTSAPEMLVSATAAFDGAPDLALGNAFGSNIANIALILGTTAVISPIIINRQVLFKETPKLLISTAIVAAFLWDDKISRIEAIILIVVFVILMGRMILISAKNKNSEIETETDIPKPEDISLGKALLKVVIGITLLVLSSKMMVWGAVGIAKILNISDLIIGLTIVAVGTSLPELAASVTAARKGNNDLAIGNVIGSNLFNIYMVIGIAGAITPIESSPEVLYRDIPIVTALSVSIIIFGLSGTKGGNSGKINRIHGLIWLLSFVGYTAYLVSTAVHN